jgi:hypothetical protein
MAIGMSLLMSVKLTVGAIAWPYRSKFLSSNAYVYKANLFVALI